jgi:hypothetical protein
MGVTPTARRVTEETSPRPSNSVFYCSALFVGVLTWVPPAQQLTVGRRDAPVLLSLLLSAVTQVP